MIGLMRPFIPLVCVVALLVSATAASAAPEAVLSTAEYTQLASAQTALKSVSSAAATLKVCKRAKAVSPLLKAWKTDCDGVANYAITRRQGPGRRQQLQEVLGNRRPHDLHVPELQGLLAGGRRLLPS